MTVIDTEALIGEWREAVAFARTKGRAAYSIPIGEMAALCDAVDAERAKVRALVKAANALLDAEAKEIRLRLLCNTEGGARAGAGEITARQYKNDYYAPTIRQQFAVDRAKDALRAALAAGEGEGEEAP